MTNTFNAYELGWFCVFKHKMKVKLTKRVFKIPLRTILAFIRIKFRTTQIHCLIQHQIESPVPFCDFHSSFRSSLSTSKRL